jgi:phosphoribosylanthranilate isomerase
MISIKFCGFQSASSVKQAVKLPIDALGFILVSGRRRTVTLSQVAKWLPIIPTRIASVGVFQNPTLEEVKEAIDVGLTAIQLHGQETVDFCRQVKMYADIQLIKVFSTHSLEKIASYRSYIDVVLLDHATGGVGKPIDWDCIPQTKQITEANDLPLWIAGGLDENNVANLCATYSINGIDLSSGIETDGTKDERKMKAIIELVT